MRERHMCTIFKLYMNCFCQQRVSLEMLIKVTSKEDRWKENKKSFTKKLISYCIFFKNKKCFHYMFAKFSIHITLSQSAQTKKSEGIQNLRKVRTRVIVKRFLNQECSNH